MEVRELRDPGEFHDPFHRIMNAVEEDAQPRGAALAAEMISLIPVESVNRSGLMSTVTGPPR